MKHVKDIVLEKRNLRDYVKYTDILKKKFSEFISIEKIMAYKEEGEIGISIKTYYGLDNRFINHLEKLFDEVVIFTINPANGTQLNINIYGVPEEFFKRLDLEIDMQKYNL